MTRAHVRKRREQISLCLQKSLTSPSLIAKQLDLPIRTVTNDLYWMKKKSLKWLAGHTLEGYVYETHQTIEQLKDIELELQHMRQEEKDVMKKKSIMMNLVSVINIRWVIQGDGPTYMNFIRARDLKEKNTR